MRLFKHEKRPESYLEAHVRETIDVFNEQVAEISAEIAELRGHADPAHIDALMNRANKLKQDGMISLLETLLLLRGGEVYDDTYH